MVLDFLLMFIRMGSLFNASAIVEVLRSGHFIFESTIALSADNVAIVGWFPHKARSNLVLWFDPTGGR